METSKTNCLKRFRTSSHPRFSQTSYYPIFPSSYEISCNTFASHVKRDTLACVHYHQSFNHWMFVFLQLTATKQQKIDADSLQHLPRLVHVVFDKFLGALFTVDSRCWRWCVWIIVAPSLIQRRSFCFIWLRFRWNSHNNWFPVLVRHLKRARGKNERSVIFRKLSTCLFDKTTSDVGSGENENQWNAIFGFGRARNILSAASPIKSISIMSHDQYASRVVKTYKKGDWGNVPTLSTDGLKAIKLYTTQTSENARECLRNLRKFIFIDYMDLKFKHYSLIC